MRDWNRFFTDDEIDKVWQQPITLANATKYLNAKIREAIEAAPMVYGGNKQWHNAGADHADYDTTAIARLVDVKPIEKGE